MSEQPACGMGLAEHSALPALLGRLTRSVADVLEAHLDALDLTDARSRLEHEAYSRLIEDHRGAGVRLMGIGDRMAGHRELPMGRHIAEAMAAPKVRESFQRFVGLEAELLELLQRRLAQDRQMLAAMGAED